MTETAGSRMDSASRPAPSSRHPRGPYTLFFAEMWERFSYYGMRALLVLYLVNALGLPRADALEIYAAYTRPGLSHTRVRRLPRGQVVGRTPRDSRRRRRHGHGSFRDGVPGDRSRYAPSPIAKQGIGMVILGLGFVVLAVAQERASVLGQVGPAWLFAVYVLHTIGELCLSPIGLSTVTKLAPARLMSALMGLWFAAMAAANYLAGTLEGLLKGSGIPLYWFLVDSSIGAGLLLLLVAPLIQRLMHGIR